MQHERSNSTTDGEKLILNSNQSSKIPVWIAYRPCSEIRALTLPAHWAHVIQNSCWEGRTELWQATLDGWVKSCTTILYSSNRLPYCYIRCMLNERSAFPLKRNLRSLWYSRPILLYCKSNRQLDVSRDCQYTWMDSCPAVITVISLVYDIGYIHAREHARAVFCCVFFRYKDCFSAGSRLKTMPRRCCLIGLTWAMLCSICYYNPAVEWTRPPILLTCTCRFTACIQHQRMHVKTNRPCTQN